MKIIESTNAPNPVGPYSQAVKKGPFLFCSGQIAIDPSSGTLKTNSIKEETTQIMENLGAVLKAAGMGFEQVVKATIFLRYMDDFQEVNAIYGKYFNDHAPARETVAVAGLPLDVNVEISLIASDQ
jgi:2-iminobutanoate/2-iminopropanoate deaminase